MFSNKMLSALAFALLLLAGTASAEQRYFEFTGTVTRSENQTKKGSGSFFRVGSEPAAWSEFHGDNEPDPFRWGVR